MADHDLTFAELEDLDEFDARLAEEDVTVADRLSYGATSKKDYFELQRYENTTSYSQQLDLHACPRKLHLKKHGVGRDEFEANLDFAFGHCVGAGVQSLLIHSDLITAQFNGWLAFNAPFEMTNKKKKNIWGGMIAIEKFREQIAGPLDEWDLYILSNGKPAIEISFSLNCNNGYKHYGHIDAILKNKRTGKIAVLELKTTGLNSAEEASYSNSSQALGYAIILEALFPGIVEYSVFYFIYSSTDREWTGMPFEKTTRNKAEWIKDLLLDHATLEQYKRINFYPKRGESCFNFFRRCEYYGQCDIIPDKQLEVLDVELREAEVVDYALNLTDIVAAQRKQLENQS